MDTNPTEAQIKGAFLQRWRAQAGLKKRHVIAPEVVLGRTQCRADLAVWNEQLIGIEVKSSRDRLTRLPRQLEAYKSIFDRVVVIADQRHIPRVLALSGNSVDIWQVGPHGELDLVREGEQPLAGPKNARVQMLKLPELKMLLGERGERASRRSALEDMCMSIPTERLHEAVVKSFCSAFSASTAAFWDRVGRRRITASDVQSLSRFAETRKMEKVRQGARDEFWARWKQEAALHLSLDGESLNPTIPSQLPLRQGRPLEYVDGY